MSTALAEWRFKTMNYLESLRKDGVWHSYNPDKKYSDDELRELLKRHNSFFSSFISDGNYFLKMHDNIRGEGDSQLT